MSFRLNLTIRSYAPPVNGIYPTILFSTQPKQAMKRL